MLNPSDGIAVFTDGSCWHKDGIGGWAFVAFDAYGTELVGHGSVADTTNNRMEMMAVEQGLLEIYHDCDEADVLVYCDSEYVVLGARDPSRSRKKNVDMWLGINHAISLHKSVTFNHVKGHADSYYNNLVDKLAGEARLSHVLEK